MTEKRSGQTAPEVMAMYAILAVLGIFFLFVLVMAVAGPRGGRPTATSSPGALESTGDQLFTKLAEEARAAAPLPAVPGGARLHSVLHPPPDMAFETRRRDGVMGNAIVLSIGPAGAGGSSEGLLLADQFRLVGYTVEGDGGLVVRRVYPAFASLNPVEYNPALQARTGRLDPEALTGALEEEVVVTAPRPAWTDIQIGLVYPVEFDEGVPEKEGLQAELNVVFTEYPGGDRSKTPRVWTRREAVPFTAAVSQPAAPAAP